MVGAAGGKSQWGFREIRGQSMVGAAGGNSHWGVDYGRVCREQFSGALVGGR